MADDVGSIHAYECEDRALLPITGIRVSRSLRRSIRRSDYTFTCDTAFREVVTACQRPDSWISDELIELVCAIHEEGWAHSGETWIDGRLVGGVYGLAIGGVFCAESMFTRETDMGKVALYWTVEKLRELGFGVVDLQFINEHTQSLGAYEVPRDEYLRQLRRLRDLRNAWSRRAR